MLESTQKNSELYKVIPKKPNAPFTKKDRLARRKEVYRLHFEEGWSAMRIADTMCIHRHTINQDIKYWYSKLTDQFSEYGHSALIQKHIIRIESQRTRLLVMLRKEQDVDRKLTIERMILDSESKLSNITFKTIDTVYSRNSLGVELANSILEDEKIGKRFHSPVEVMSISEGKRSAIDRILRSKR